MPSSPPSLQNTTAAGGPRRRGAGGEIAGNLDSLYAYMTERLLTANLQNKAEMLDEVQTLLTDLRDAWTQIGEKPAAPSALASHYPVMASA